MTGTLHGVGLGPGDPELITLKAARLIAAAQVVAYPAAAGTASLARRIAAGLIPPGAREIAFELPMRPDREPAQEAYDTAAAAIAQDLAQGTDVVCLCEGDPLFYGTFMYLAARLSPRFAVQVVPGVTSVSAAAACAGLPLAARSGSLAVLPGPLPDAELAAGLRTAGTVAILKAGRHLGRLRAVIAAEGLLDRATYVARVSWPDQQVLPLAEAPDPAPYFSLILVCKERDPWL